MRVVHALPFILPLLPLSQVLAVDLNDELVALSMRHDDIINRMRTFKPRFDTLASVYAPAETWRAEVAKPENAKKYTYPQNLKVWINDQWKFFRIIDEMGLDPRIRLSAQDQQAIQLLEQSKQWALTVQRDHCPREPMEIEMDPALPTSRKLDAEELNLKRQCWQWTLKYAKTWQAYIMMFTKIRAYRALINIWQEDPEWEAGLEYELKKMADRKMTNTDWIKWLTAEVEASSDKKKPAFDQAEYQHLQTPQATWAEWSRFYMKYTRPANKQAPTGQLDFNTPEERNIADAYVKKRLTWQYHRKMVAEFLVYFDSALPKDSDLMLNVHLGVQDQIGRNEVPNAEAIKDDILEEFQELDNDPERDPKFHFKKAKGLDAKLAFIAEKPSIGRFVNEDFTERTAQEALKVMQKIEKGADPKIHPRDRPYMISDMMRRALEMPSRKINAAPLHMNPPPDKSRKDDDDGRDTGREGAPLNPGNNRKLPKVKSVM